MNDAELVAELRYLGIDGSSYRALALLPMVQVAWADGTVQDAERELILKLAGERYHLEEEGRRQLDNWLRYAPSDSYVSRGRHALVELAGRSSWISFDPEALVDVVELSADVARAAGGLFGFRAVDADEAIALEEIREAIDKARSARLVSVPIRGRTQSSDTEDDAEGPVEIEFHGDVPEHVEAVLVRTDDDAESAYPVAPAGLTVGRLRSNGVQIANDAKVSRVHCRVHRANGRWYLVDADSQNGVTVNGERVHERRLFGGEELEIGSTRFEFRLVDPT